MGAEVERSLRWTMNHHDDYRYHAFYQRKRKRRKRTSTKARKSGSAATLARREKRLANLLRRLRDLQSDAEFVTNEQAKKDRFREIMRENEERRDAAAQAERDSYNKAVDEISAIYRRESKQFVDRRSWWNKLTTFIPEFKYDLPSPGHKANYSSVYGHSSGGYRESFGHFLPTEETQRKVVAIENRYIETCARIREDDSREREKRRTEVDEELATLAPHKTGHKTIDQIPEVETALKKCRSQLAQANCDEQSLRKVYRVDDQTIAQAAAHAGQTRELAGELRPEIRNQLQISNNCPYCEEELTNEQHADHIYPVSRGGLSTPDNLVLVCVRCNLAKHDMTIREFCVKFELDRNAIESRLLHLGKRI